MKKLPVTLNTGLTTECWTFAKLAAILASPQYLPWYMERFIFCVVDEYFNFGHSEIDSLEALCNYDEVITSKNITEKDDITKSIIQEIDKSRYVIALCDYYYIEGSREYMKKHWLHNMLIYGYDHNSKEFNYIGFYINNKYWGEHVIKFDMLKEAFNNGLNIIDEDIDNYIYLFRHNLPATAIYLNEDFNREPRIELIYSSIVKCLRGGEVIISNTEEDSFCSGVRRFGVSIYKSYYENLYNILLSMPKDLFVSSFERMSLIEGAMKALVENKQRLHSLWNYLNEGKFVIIPMEIIDNTKLLCKLLEQVHQLSIKYSLTMEAKYMEMVKYKLIEAQKKDIEILTEAKNVLHKYMKKRVL